MAGTRRRRSGARRLSWGERAALPGSLLRLDPRAWACVGMGSRPRRGRRAALGAGLAAGSFGRGVPDRFSGAPPRRTHGLELTPCNKLLLLRK